MLSFACTGDSGGAIADQGRIQELEVDDGSYMRLSVFLIPANHAGILPVLLKVLLGLRPRHDHAVSIDQLGNDLHVLVVDPCTLRPLEHLVLMYNAVRFPETEGKTHAISVALRRGFVLAFVAFRTGYLLMGLTHGLGGSVLGLELDVGIDEGLGFAFVAEVVGIVLEVDELVRALVGRKL